MTQQAIKRAPRGRRLIIIVWLFAGVIICLLGLAYYSIALLSAGRAYIGGEGLWSKSQKQAVLSLSRYARYRQEDDYLAFRRAIEVTLGDRQARLEMEKPEPDLAVVRSGFIAGRNHPDDVDGMIHLFRTFRRVPDLDRVIGVWAAADARIDELIREGNWIHDEVRNRVLDEKEMLDALKRIMVLDTQLTPLEDEFSYVLGEVQRKTQMLLFVAMAVVSLLLLLTAVILSRRILQRSDAERDALSKSEAQLRDLLQMAPLPLTITSTSSQKLLYANERAIEQFSLPRTFPFEFPNQSTFAGPGGRSPLMAAFERDGFVRDAEVLLQDTAGQSFWALVSSQRIRYQGEPCAFTAIANIDERKRLQDAMQYRAYHDALTNLPNRAMFMEALGRAISKAQRHTGLFSLLFIDLDRFKVINDTLGHQVGDRLLQDVAARLSACVRESDLVARLGGDEFVILIEEHRDHAEVVSVAQKILAALEKVFLLDGRELTLTASVGISNYPADGTTLDALVKNADIAMYQAKEQGRNNFQFYAAPLNTLTMERFDFERRLRGALERNEFVVHYQPVIDLATGRICTFEALLRWNDPAAGLVMPADFITLAEDTGTIIPIGQWVLESACRQTQAWHAAGLKDIGIAVNMSARQFLNHGVLAEVARTLQRSGLDARFLHLEITESMMLKDEALADSLLASLKEMGVGVAIDDFGTGHSSLSRMKQLPANWLKIDRSFVKDCPDDAASLAIVRAIIAMARSLRLKVVAEGVETEAQLRALMHMGCDMAQGYYFSRAVAAETVPSLAGREWPIASLTVRNPLHSVKSAE